MEHYVYIIFSQNSSKYYRGYSTDPYKRIISHNKNESNYTKNKGPWELIYIECLETKKLALIREKVLKKYSHSQIQQLIKSPKNILKK
tara:strand:+ start:4684 stop:4947 length:264 start_codon:yes stop_codon:yes gene_type:complete